MTIRSAIVIAPPDTELMDLALTEARQAEHDGDVPVGAVVWRDGTIIGRGRNRREQDLDPTAHAEIVALRQAAAATGSWRLTGATVAVTLEPCPMCAGALLAARVARVVVGTLDIKAGAMGSLYNLGSDPRLNHEVDLVWGVREDECAAMLSQFFAAVRDGTAPARRPQP